jgi:hypothetical protein
MNHHKLQEKDRLRDNHITNLTQNGGKKMAEVLVYLKDVNGELLLKQRKIPN